MLNAKYTVKDVPGNPDLKQIGISPLQLTMLTLKCTGWAMIPYALAGAAVYALTREPKPTNTEDHLPTD